MRKLLLVVAVVFGTSAMAQTVLIKKVELAGENIIVHYDLEDSNPNNEYLINLYSSKDNYYTALTKVSGDVGMDVKPGLDKKITWKIRDEYGGYKGKIALELRGKVYVPFVRLQGFDTKQKYKKGKTVDLKWKVGASNPINIELYKGAEHVTADLNQPNNGSHTFFFQKHLKSGKDYRLKFTDTRNTEEVLYTDYFRVGPKIPLWMIAAPVVVVGAVVAILSGHKSPSTPGEQDDEKLPAAPDPQ